MDITAITIALLGGLCLFLYGMEQMTEALKNIAGDKLKTVLKKFTGNRFSAVFTGAFVTSVIQSSSVTTVLVVGFISAGMMSLLQAVGVIMGANIGTTVTAQIIAFKVTKYAMILIISGFTVNFLAKKEQFRWLGTMLFGLGLIFFGMDFMSQATSPLRTHPPFIEVMASMTNPVFGITAAALFTALVQSSSATTGIVIVLASQGFITLESGIALALGANIGTCSTALLSTIGKPREALQAATVHVIFNVLGAFIWIFLIDYLAELVRYISPVAEHLSGAEKMSAEVPRQIANAHTMFNILNTVIFIGFTSKLAAVAQKIIPSKTAEDRAKPLYLNEEFLVSPPLAVNQLRMEVMHLGKLTDQLFCQAFHLTKRESDESLENINSDCEKLYKQISDYSRKIVINSKTASDAENVSVWMMAAQYLKSIGETLLLNNQLIYEHDFQNRKIKIPEMESRFTELAKFVRANLCTVISAVEEENMQKAKKVIKNKPEFNRSVKQLQKLLREKLLTADARDVDLYQNEQELIELLKRVNYFIRRTAKNLPENDDTATV